MAFDARKYNTMSREELMSIPQNEIPAPKNLPSGHYIGVVTGYSIGPTPWNADTEALFYTCQLLEPSEDVSPEALDGIDIKSYQLRPMAYELIPDRMRDISRLHASMGLNTSLSTDQNVPEAVGKRVLMNINANPSKRAGDDRVFNNIVSLTGIRD